MSTMLGLKPQEPLFTSKQYLAVADDFIRKLFPELTPERLPYPGSFTIFITDDVVH